jgi:hypothetical protein
MLTTLLFATLALGADVEPVPRVSDDVRLTAATGSGLLVVGYALGAMEGASYKPGRDVGTVADFSGISMLLASEHARRNQLARDGRDVSAVWAYVGWGLTAGAATTSVTALVSSDPRTLRLTSTALRIGALGAMVGQAVVNTKATRAPRPTARAPHASEPASRFAWTVSPMLDGATTRASGVTAGVSGHF